MSSTISPDATLAELVVERPSRSRVFEQFGLDYCCGGGSSLATQCHERGLDVSDVLDALAVAAPSTKPPDLIELEIGEIVELLENDHVRLRGDLERLSRLLANVVRAHGDQRPHLHEVAATFEQLRVLMETHFVEEEERVFPACVGWTVADPRQLAHVLFQAQEEHVEVGRLLGRLFQLTDGFSTDSAMCGTHRAAIDGLRELAIDVREHTHRENNILFPRVLQLMH